MAVASKPAPAGTGAEAASGGPQADARSLYGPADLAGLDYALDLNDPGGFPLHPRHP